jgi:hypothetical protein
MAIDLIGKHRFSQSADGPSVVDMTTYRMPTPAAAADGNRPARRRLDLPNLVWALAATH